MPNHALEQSVERALEASSQNTFAVFDFDNTCIINDIAEATLAYLCGNKLLRDTGLLGPEQGDADYNERVFSTYHALLGAGKVRAAYLICGRMFSGFTHGEAEALALAAITNEGVRIGSKMLYGIHIERGLAVRPRVRSLMEYLRAKGVRIWIVSASPEPCVRAATRHFGIDGKIIGVRAIVRDGVFTSELEAPIPMKEGKPACIKRFIDGSRSPILAAGDSINDLPMLEMADIKVVVERDNALAETARERGWFVL